VGLCALVTAVVSSGTAFAEDVAKKFRIAASMGPTSGRAEITTSAANQLTLIDNNLVPVGFVLDPRNDSAVADSPLSIETAPLATISAEYAFTSTFILQASIGYQRGNVGPVDVQAQFPNQISSTGRAFDFRKFPIEAGTLKQVPLQVTAIARFRSKKSFNPYVGIGAGYIWTGFESSDQLNVLSDNMSRSKGAIAFLDVNLGASRIPDAPDPGLWKPLSGATVDAPDSLEWHLAGGFEISFKKNWAVFMDLRYTFTSQEFTIRFDGKDSMGVPVPLGTDYAANYAGQSLGAGPMYVGSGGLLDAGRETNPNPDNPAEIVFEFEPDGIVDPGYYYVQGGRLKYDSLGALVGVKYTF